MEKGEIVESLRVYHSPWRISATHTHQAHQAHRRREALETRFDECAASVHPESALNLQGYSSVHSPLLRSPRKDPVMKDLMSAFSVNAAVSDELGLLSFFAGEGGRNKGEGGKAKNGRTKGGGLRSKGL